MADVSRSEKYPTRLLARSRLSADTLQIDLERPSGFSFVPGQGIRLSSNGLEREYTLVCGPNDDQLSICVQVVENGAFSPLLARLETGNSLLLSGPHGYFTFQTKERPAVFVATGTGIAPFVSMVRAGVSGFTLLQGATTSTDLHYRDITQPASRCYVGCITGEQAKEEEAAWRHRGRVSDFLKKKLSPGIFDFYLCGRREMVRDVVSIVDDLFSGSKVFFEIFF
jgi:ferredoxin-NADP reductase